MDPTTINPEGLDCHDLHPAVSGVFDNQRLGLGGDFRGSCWLSYNHPWWSKCENENEKYILFIVFTIYFFFPMGIHVSFIFRGYISYKPYF